MNPIERQLYSTDAQGIFVMFHDPYTSVNVKRGLILAFIKYMCFNGD
jgi:hypothetical protein